MNLKQRLIEDEDFICSKRFAYSVQKALERYPEGCPDRVISASLMINVEDIPDLYESIIDKLKQAMTK